MKKKISDFIAKYEMLQAGDRVLIALSGGADSVYLTLILQELQQSCGITLCALHVNHQIRGAEAERDEAFVRAFCQKLQLPLEVCSYPVARIARERHQSLEEAGREIRKEVLNRYAREKGCNRIAYAHHETDLAETMLHHLARGSSLPGLVALRPVRGHEIRPLLCVSGEQIRRELVRRQEAWCEDSTNQEDAYTRNGIRHHVLPYLTREVNAETIHHMAETSLDLLEAEEYLKLRTRELTEGYVSVSDQGLCLGEELLREPGFMVRRVIRECLIRAVGQARDLTRNHVEAVLDLLEGPVSRQVSLPGGLVARRSYAGVLFRRQESGGAQGTEERELRIFGEGSFRWDENTVFVTRYTSKKEEKEYTKCIPYDKIKNGFTVRTRRPGDYLVVNQAGGRKKLKNYLIDRKIPQEDRASMLLICAGQEVLWIPGDRMGCWKEPDESSGFLEITCSRCSKEE